MVWNGIKSRRHILWEEQSGNCRGCGVHIPSHKNSGRAQIGDVDFIACLLCVATVGEYSSVEEFTEDHSSGRRTTRLEENRQKRAAARVENPEGYQTVVDHVRALGSDLEVPDHFRYLPVTAKFDSIAFHLVKGNLTVEERRIREKAKTARRRLRRGKPYGGSNLHEKKMRLGEAQGHRCAYCHQGLHYEKKHDFTDWFYATFEHVLTVNEIERSEFNSKANLIIACAFCNRERDRLNMSATQFYTYVQNNPSGYEAQRRNMAHPPFISKQKWLKTKKRLQITARHHINKVPMLTNVK